jgi:hypothetical protein
MSDFSAGYIYTGRLEANSTKAYPTKDNQKLINFNIYARIRDVCLHLTRKCSTALYQFLMSVHHGDPYRTSISGK